MTQPTTPGDAIRRAAQRHKATVDATKQLSADIAAARAEQAAPSTEEVPK